VEPTPLLRLVNDLLDVERIRTGKMHIDQEPVDLHCVMAHAVQAVQPQAQEKSIRVKRKSVSTTCVVSGDESRLYQILLNLLSNAIKFTPQGGSVDICMISQGDTMEFTVSDTGRASPLSSYRMPLISSGKKRSRTAALTEGWV
jgi:signal transduction histidine kinase